jgi:hypothetical protein
MLLSLFGEASSLPANQHIMHLLYSATVHCSVGKMPSLTLSGTTSSHHISLRPILISCYRPSLHIRKDFFPLILFRPKLNMQLSFLVRVVLHGSPKFGWFDYPNHTSRRPQIVDLYVCNCFQACCNSLLLRVQNILLPGLTYPTEQSCKVDADGSWACRGIPFTWRARHWSLSAAYCWGSSLYEYSEGILDCDSRRPFQAN